MTLLPDGGATYNLAAALLDPHLEAGRGDRVALRHAGRDITYAEVAADVARASAALRGLGMRPEERVVVLLPDVPELIATFLGAVRLGAVPVPVNPSLGADALAHPIVDSRATTVVCADAALDAVRSVLADHPARVRAVVRWGPAGEPAPDTAGELSALLAEATPDDEAEPTSADDVAFWLYSSGTTGRPKAVAHTHAAAAHSFAGLARDVLGVSGHDRIYSVAKLFSPSGLGNSMFFPFFSGGSAVLVPGQPSGDVVATTVTRERPTLLFARPVNYRQILDSVPAEAMSSVRLAVCSGDRLPAELREAFRERYAVDVCEGTGSTEALHIYLCNRPGRIRAGSSGELVPGYDARIVGDDGRPVGDGEIGDLHIRGGSTLLCYWRNRAKTRETLIGDWVVTGDKYSRDADGYYWYAGRSDDMWLEAGQWVSPVDIEEVLASATGVREAAVTRVAGAEPYVLACVVLDDAALDDPAALDDDPGARLAALVEDKLGAARRPDRVVVVPALPRTASGKTQRHRLPELVDGDGVRR